MRNCRFPIPIWPWAIVFAAVLGLFEQAWGLEGEIARLRSEQLKLAKKLVSRYPNDFDAWRLLGYAYSSRGETDAAYRCWERCHRLDPTRTDVLAQMARHCMAQDEVERAIGLWAKAVARDPGDVALRIGHAEALLKAGHVSEAEQASRAALEVDPSSAAGHFLLGELQFAHGEYAQALQSFQRSVQRNASDSRAYYGIIKSAARLGEQRVLESARKRFAELEARADEADRQRRAQHRDADVAKRDMTIVCREAGQVLLRHGRAGDAQRIWRYGLQVGGPDLQTGQLLATSYAREGRTDEASRVWRDLLAAIPKSAEAHAAYAEFLLATGADANEALSHAHRAVALAPNAGRLYLLARVLAAKGEHDLARRAVTQAIRADPKNDEYRRFLEQIPSRQSGSR